MSRSTSKAPHQDQTVTVEPFPDAEVEQSGLDADFDLTLGKKRSWFGSLRDALQKGALQAKAAVESIRGDPNNSTQISSADGVAESESQPRHLMDDASSTTALLKQEHEPCQDRAPKSAIASLRNHLPHQVSKHHHKRSSVCNASARPSSEMSEIPGPEHFVSHCGTATGHKKHNSVTNSLVGSIRGLGRKKGKAPELPVQKAISPKDHAEIVLLPSSPINIPVAAPALELDLGPAGFMSSTFPSPVEKRMNQEDLKLMDPANIASGRPEPLHLHLAMDSNSMSCNVARGATPRDILKIPVHTTDGREDASPIASATPMPGSNFGLEVDGANSEKSDKSEVFERTVTPTNEKEQKELRTMRSLGAMAEACATAQGSDEMTEAASPIETRSQSDPSPTNNSMEQTDVDSMEARRWSDPGFFDAAASCELYFYTPRERALSGFSESTISRCPSDMEELTREKANVPMAGGESQEDVKPAHGLDEDPFTASSGTSFNLRRMTLPFRPKMAPEDDLNSGGVGAERHRSRAQSADQHDIGKVVGLLEPLSPDHPGAAQRRSRHNHVAVQGSGGDEHSPGIVSSSDEIEQLERIASDDDTQARAGQPPSSDIVLLAYDDTASPESAGMSPRGGSLLPGFYQCIRGSPNSSPGSARSRTTYTAGIVDAGYKFTFDKCLQATSPADEPDDEILRTPGRRSLDISIDSVSTKGERQTPRVSRMSGNEEHTPPMGNKLEFNLKRSQRNMRYNALQQDREVEYMDETGPVVVCPSIRFTLGSSEEIDANAFALADFDNAYASSSAGSPLKDANAVAASNASGRSVANSLPEATLIRHKFEDPLSERESDPKTSTGLEGTVPVTTSWRILPSDSVSGKSDSREGADSLQDRGCQSQTLKYGNSRKAMEYDDILQKRTGFSPMPEVPQYESRPSSGDTEATAEKASPSQGAASSRLQVDVSESESSADLLPVRIRIHAKDRATSSDTLDDSLNLFGSPDSGYQADKSSVSPLARPKSLPARRKQE